MSGVLAVTQPYGVGLGIQEPFRGADPGAGVNFTYPIDGYGLRRLLAIVFTLTTSGTSANRYVTVEGRGGDNLAFNADGAGVVVTATSTQRFVGSFTRGRGEWAANTDVLFSLTPIMLYPGNTLNIIVAAIQSGDTLTNIRGVFERFPLTTRDLPTESP